MSPDERPALAGVLALAGIASLAVGVTQFVGKSQPSAFRTLARGLVIASCIGWILFSALRGTVLEPDYKKSFCEVKYAYGAFAFEFYSALSAAVPCVAVLVRWVAWVVERRRRVREGLQYLPLLLFLQCGLGVVLHSVEGAQIWAVPAIASSGTLILVTELFLTEQALVRGGSSVTPLRKCAWRMLLMAGPAWGFLYCITSGSHDLCTLPIIAGLLWNLKDVEAAQRTLHAQHAAPVTGAPLQAIAQVHWNAFIFLIVLNGEEVFLCMPLVHLFGAAIPFHVTAHVVLCLMAWEMCTIYFATIDIVRAQGTTRMQLLLWRARADPSTSARSGWATLLGHITRNRCEAKKRC